jgi:hypothetical protein
MITQEAMRKEVEYRDGHFYKLSNGTMVTETPIKGIQRYVRVNICGVPHRLHRLVFLYHKGYLPKIIDHIDNDRANNRIENLREVTQQQNCLNRVAHKNNKSGYKNVHWHSAMNKWTVQISIDRKRRVFGYFDDVELAGLVAEEARDKFHGEFARH